MATTLNMTLLLRRAEFADSCILQAGEPGYNTKTKEFKIGDGSTQWGNLPIANKSQIDAIVSAAITAHAAGYYTKSEIDSFIEAVTEAASDASAAVTAEAQAREAADTQIRTDFAAADATTLNHAKGYADTKKAEVIGASGNASTADTIYGAKKYAEEKASAAQSAAISAAATDATTKANTAESNAKTYAETKASAAQSAAESTAESKDAARAQAAATNLANAVSALETKISTGDSTTLQSAKSYTDEKVAAEAKLRSDADDALDARLDKIETFIGAADADGQEGGLYDALDTLAEIQKYITDEGAAADQMVKDIAQNASDIEALDEQVGKNEAAITTLGTNKLDKSVYDTYINGKSMSDAQLKKYAEDEADAAQSAAITKAGELDTALHTVISKEIDGDVKAAIDAEKLRADGAYDVKNSASTAETNAKNYADSQDAALKTALEGASNDASSKATIAGAKKYAEEKASAAESAAKTAVIGTSSDAKTANTVYGAKAFATDAANTAKSAVIGTSSDTKTSDTIKGAKKYADDVASTAKSEAISAVVGTAGDGADSDTIKGVRKAFEAADATVLSTAKTYAETQVTNAHKNYQTATVKDATHDSATNPSFITSISIEKGHVTGATVQNLASVLAAMEFIFDGGTSAN